MNDDPLSRIFVKWSLLEWWDTLLQAYKEMGFTDKLSDQERIAEFHEITELMNGWIGKAEKVVIPFWPYKQEEGIEAFSLMKERLPLNTRIRIVYARLRDNWSEGALAILTNLADTQERVEEEKESDDNGIERNHYEF